MFARTERLLLRPGWADDADALAQAIAFPEVAKMLGHVPWPYDVADARRYLDAHGDPQAPNALIFLRTAGKPRLIGGLDLVTEGSEHQLSFWISPAYWGLGFATEAARACVDFARDTLRLPAIHASHFIDNSASGHVLRKLGFERTGCAAPAACVARGSDVLAVSYALNLLADAGTSPDAQDHRSLLAA